MRKFLITFLSILMLFQICAMPVYAGDGKISDVFNGKIEIVNDPEFSYDNTDYSSKIILSMPLPSQMLSLKDAYNRTQYFNDYYNIHSFKMGFQTDIKIGNNGWLSNDSWDKFQYNNLSNNTDLFYTYDYKINPQVEGSSISFALLKTDDLSIDYENSVIKDMIDVKTEGEGTYYIINEENVKYRIRGYVYYKDFSGKEYFVFSDWKTIGENNNSSENTEPTISDIDIPDEPKTETKQVPLKIEKTTVKSENGKTIIGVYLERTDEYLKVLNDYTSNTKNTNFDVKLSFIKKVMPEEKDTTNMSAKEKKAYEEERQKAMEEYKKPFDISKATVYNCNTELNKENQSNLFYYEIDGEIKENEYSMCGIAVSIDDSSTFVKYTGKTEIDTLSHFSGTQVKDNVGNDVEPDGYATSENNCPVCKHCSQPLGLCIWIWVIIIAVVAILGTIIAVVLKIKKNREDAF